jgi:hypothetical protein
MNDKHYRRNMISERNRKAAEYGAVIRQRDEAVALVRELVELKALHDRIDGLQYDSYVQYTEMSSEYEKRKPKAWESARAFLAHLEGK